MAFEVEHTYTGIQLFCLECGETSNHQPADHECATADAYEDWVYRTAKEVSEAHGDCTLPEFNNYQE